MNLVLYLTGLSSKATGLSPPCRLTQLPIFDLVARLWHGAII
jgi:hypothetical protein